MTHNERIDNSVEILKSSTSDEERQKAIQVIAREFSQKHSSNEMLAIAKKMDELIPILNDILTNSEESTSIRNTIVSFYKGKTMYPEIYEALKVIFLEGIDDHYLSITAGKYMMYFYEKLEETKKLFVEQLQSEKEHNRLLGLKVISIWNKETRLDWDYIPMFMQIAKEDKSPKVRSLAWSHSSRRGTEYPLQFIVDDVLYSSLYDVLGKFQPNIQVPLTRIIELTEHLPLQKIKELIENFQLNKIAISKEQYKEAIKKLLESKQIVGEYFNLEQVFVRKESKDLPLKPVSFSKEHLCFNCGNPLEDISKNCPSCNQEVLKCNVCKLPVNFGQEIGRCTYCESVGHLTHLQEWVKIKGKCPTCQKKLQLEEVVPTTAFEVKK
ncbi:MAG: hypothetical protein HZR80_18770 [Candidatus Heimdallarchaeota archaeon]